MEEDIFEGPYLVMPDGKRYFDNERAVIELLQAEVLFVAGGLDGYKMTELEVNCNDVFAWASADCEPIPAYSLEKLWIRYNNDKKWGTIKWCCIHRNSKPQKPIINDMKKDGVWDSEMESLPDNIYKE